MGSTSDLSVLVRTTAPWLRGFPSIVALDDKAGKMLFRANLIAPALGFVQGAQTGAVSQPYKRVQGCPARNQGRKAANLAVGDTTNLVLAAVGKVAASQSGIAANSADEEALAQRLAGTLLATRVHVTALAETMQPDLRHAVNAVIEEVEL